jgi:UDP-4-amino-4,6-dideoxy-N-acetyl-beta-L-altrosamine transaminase
MSGNNVYFHVLMENIYYGRHKIEDEDIRAVEKVLRGDFLTQGPTVAELESDTVRFLQNIASDPTEIYASAVTNGTAALHLACMALGVKPGDRVLVTALSFVASANAVLYCGGEVEFVDIDSKTHCLDLDLLELKLASQKLGHYQGVVIVDFAGVTADLKRLRKLADQYQFWIIEDACHAFGGTRTDSSSKKYAAGACAYSDIATYSFHPVKHIAMGEGGMVLTRKKSLHDQITLLRTHGITRDPTKLKKIDGGWHYEMQALGYNYRASDILCALAKSQLSRIDANLKRRQEIAAEYQTQLSGLPIILPEIDPSVFHAYHLFVILTDRRKELYDYLLTQKIILQVHYNPIPKQPYYVERYGVQSFPVSEHYYDRCLSLPMYHSLSKADQTRVISAIQEFFKNK